MHHIRVIAAEPGKAPSPLFRPQPPACPCREETRLTIPSSWESQSWTWLLGWLGRWDEHRWDEQLLGSHGPSRQGFELSGGLTCPSSSLAGLVETVLQSKALGLFAFSVVGLAVGLAVGLPGAQEPLPSPSVLPCLPPLRDGGARAACRKRMPLGSPCYASFHSLCKALRVGGSRIKIPSLEFLCSQRV